MRVGSIGERGLVAVGLSPEEGTAQGKGFWQYCSEAPRTASTSCAIVTDS